MGATKSQLETRAPETAQTILHAAGNLLTFIQNWGHPEWVVVAAEAPIEKVSSLLASTHSAKQVFHQVPVRLARKQDEEIAALVAVVKCAGTSWSVAHLVLSLPINEADYKSAQQDARMLSAKLKTRALTFVGEDTSLTMVYHLYRNGREILQKEWDQAQTRAADKAFAELGLYLPACYPCAERGAPWLATTSSSISRVERATLIKFGEPPEDKNARALLNAVLKNKLPEVRQLLRQGVKPTREALNKAIVKAAWSGKHDILNELLKRTAGEKIPFSPGVVRVAISKGHKNPGRRIEVVKLLLAAGADINGEGGEALRLAMRQEDLSLVRFLLEAGADVNVSNEHGSTPLHYAAFLGDVEFARLFLQAGARLDAKNSDGKTPAQWAVFHQRKEVAKLLQLAADP